MNNNEDEKSTAEVAAERIKQKVKQKATKAAKHAIKKVAKKVLKKLATAVVRVVAKALAFLASIIAPYILVIVGALLALLIIYIATTMFFSFGSDELDDKGKELLTYIEEQADKSVDPDKPEQAPFKVPANLIVATMQIHDSEDFGKEEKEIVDDVVEALKPIFTYVDKKIKVKTKKYTCVKVGEGKDNCTNEVSEKTETVKVLSKVEAWDRKVTFNYKKTESSWVDSESKNKTSGEGKNKTTTSEGTAEQMESLESEEEMTPDYGHFDTTLRKDPLNYGDNDIKMVEVLYLATEAEMFYTEWLNGEEFELSSYDIGYSDIDVTPGSGVPAEYMPFYLAVQKKYGIPWYYMASIHFQETRYGTNLSESSAGAVGHTQFMKCTWIGWSAQPMCDNASKDQLYSTALIKKHGGYGVDADGDGKANPWNVADSTMATGKYLKAIGFVDGNKHKIREALADYGGVDAYWYADEVMPRAEKYKKEATYDANGNVTSDVKVTGAADSPMMPLKEYRVTSMYGPRTLLGTRKENHKAMDFAAPAGTPIMAITDGKVLRSNNNCPQSINKTCGMGWGNFIWSQQTINGKRYEVVYGHMTKVIASIGSIKKGQVIGTVGDSGDSYGAHLHIEMHKGVRISYQNVVNPALYLPYK